MRLAREFTFLAVSLTAALVSAIPDYTGLYGQPHCRSIGCCTGREDKCASPILGVYSFKYCSYLNVITTFYQLGFDNVYFLFQLLPNDTFYKRYNKLCVKFRFWHILEIFMLVTVLEFKEVLKEQ